MNNLSFISPSKFNFMSSSVEVVGQLHKFLLKNQKIKRKKNLDYQKACRKSKKSAK